MFLLINALFWGTCSLLLTNSNGDDGKEEIEERKWLKKGEFQGSWTKGSSTEMYCEAKSEVEKGQRCGGFFSPVAFVFFCFPPPSPCADPLNMILLKLPGFLRPKAHCRSLYSTILEWTWNVYESFCITCECLSLILLNSLVWEEQVISTSQCFCYVSS